MSSLPVRTVGKESQGIIRPWVLPPTRPLTMHDLISSSVSSVSSVSTTTPTLKPPRRGPKQGIKRPWVLTPPPTPCTARDHLLISQISVLHAPAPTSDGNYEFSRVRSLNDWPVLAFHAPHVSRRCGVRSHRHSTCLWQPSALARSSLSLCSLYFRRPAHCSLRSHPTAHRFLPP